MAKSDGEELMTFGGHLEVLRRMLLRIAAVSGALAVAVFCLKDTVWRLLLAPSERQFTTYRWIEQAAQAAGYDFHFETFSVDLIATDLSSQFMTHITTSVYLGLLGASPYIVYELLRFISPALYEHERRYSLRGGGGGLRAIRHRGADELFRDIPHIVQIFGNLPSGGEDT